MRRTIVGLLAVLLGAALPAGAGLQPHLASGVELFGRAPLTVSGEAGVRKAGKVSVSPSGWFDNVDTGFPGGEPTLTVLKDGSILAQAMTDAVKSTDGGRTWKSVHSVPGGLTLDPYIHSDPESGRILSSQLYGACQLISISDDGGDSWLEFPTQCPAGDHQKIGSGPWPEPLTGVHPRAFFTCMNHVADTACAISADGGMTWGPWIVVFPGIDPAADDGVAGQRGVCGGLLGDPVAGPDGTIYVPREYCGRPFVGVSKNGGLTWSTHWVAEPARTLPIAFGANNPSVFVDDAGTVYYAWTGNDWRHYVSSSKDQGETWSKPVDVTPSNVATTTFPHVIAGKGGRVATAFIGTSNGPANPGDVGRDAHWHLYLSISENADDPASRWRTVQVTKHPIQIGCVGRHGGEKGCRNGNLLDFNDLALLKDGRVVISYTDGCLADCDEASESEASRLAVAIQRKGPPLR